MTTDQIIALAGGIPTIITAITGLIIAIKSNGTAKNANARVTAHLNYAHPLKKGTVVTVTTPPTPNTPDATEPVPTTPKVGEAGASLMGFGNQQGASGPEPAAVEPADLGTAETDVLSDVAQDAAPVETAVSEDVPLVREIIDQIRKLADDLESKHL